MRAISIGLLVASTPLLTFSSSAFADSIGFNFISDRNAAAELRPDETAGVVPQQNWNNFVNVPAADGPYTWDMADIGSPIAGEITEDDAGTAGVLADVTVSWTALHSWDVPGNFPGDGDDKLMNGYIDNDTSVPQMTITVENLPASYTLFGYSVIAYLGSDENGRTGTVGITDGDTYSYSSNSNLGGTFPESYVQTNDTVNGSPPANYAVWEEQVADRFTLTLDRGSHNSGFHGLQIIANPGGAPAFAITSLDYDDAANSATITWTAKAGRAYAVEASGDLVTWNELDDGVVATGDTASYTEENIADGTLVRFYRVKRT